MVATLKGALMTDVVIPGKLELIADPRFHIDTETAKLEEDKLVINTSFAARTHPYPLRLKPGYEDYLRTFPSTLILRALTKGTRTMIGTSVGVIHNLEDIQFECIYMPHLPVLVFDKLVTLPEFARQGVARFMVGEGFRIAHQTFGIDYALWKTTDERDASAAYERIADISNASFRKPGEPLVYGKRFSSNAIDRAIFMAGVRYLVASPPTQEQL